MRLMQYILLFNTWEVTAVIESDRNGCCRLDLGHLQVTKLELSMVLCLCFASSIMFFPFFSEFRCQISLFFLFIFFHRLHASMSH